MLRVFSVFSNQNTLEHIKSGFEVNLSWINAVQYLWQGFLKGLIWCKWLAMLPSMQEYWKLACLLIKVVQDVSEKKYEMCKWFMHNAICILNTVMNISSDVCNRWSYKIIISFSASNELMDIDTLIIKSFP